MTRVERLFQELKFGGLEGAFLTSKANIFYYTNYYTDPHERLVALYIDATGNRLLILPSMEKEDAKQAGWNGDLLTYKDTENPWKMLESYLDHKPSSIGIEKEQLPVSRYEQLTQIFNQTEFKDTTELFNHIRMVKDAEEYKRLKEAAELADYGVKVGVEAISEGKTELEILASIEYALKRQGVREMSFSTMVLSGHKTASPHGAPGMKKIKKGDLVLFDLGVVLNGYCSDITRTVAYQHVDKQQKEIYETVLAAQKNAIDQVKEGIEIGTIDQVARDQIKANGYGEYFTHRIGHGIGIDVHEYPSLTSHNPLKIRKGMSFTIEPGIYVPGIGGVRIEDEIFVTENGVELLTTYPKEMQIV
ncbi:Xaa-Pro peptidase family protein [Radiobacillus kanasensis]|uniref:M24 family metallopeptidase n=1 Tax=Radiobacillus kanasensis TaxID=2844358 RepID=UPI001E40B027|nr:Xaa-Pro peptidase family protein [Radiobacillus kanasensis]UFT98029.1 Xaa-Pro peptidase family protein [Radiobacillus kanasensis]